MLRDTKGNAGKEDRHEKRAKPKLETAESKHRVLLEPQRLLVGAEYDDLTVNRKRISAPQAFREYV